MFSTAVPIIGMLAWFNGTANLLGICPPKEMITPFGLRSLSNRDINFLGNHKLDRDNGDFDYFKGSILPWSIGDYIIASVKYGNQDKTGLRILKELISNFETLYKKDCLLGENTSPNLVK